MSETVIFERTTLEGELLFNGDTAPLTVHVFSGPECRLQFDVEPIDTSTYMLALQSDGRPGTTIEEFKFIGQSTDGKSIASERMYLTGHNSSTSGKRISISSHMTELTVPLKQPVEKPALRVWLRSFESFRNPVFNTPIGRLDVRGKTTTDSPDDMSGWITLEAHSSRPGNDWREEAERFLRHIQDGLALAHGGRLQTPLVEYFHESQRILTFYNGTGFKPELPVQSYLHQGPFIEALVQRYADYGPLHEMLWTALGWMQTHSTFDDVRFLTAMTALETVIETQLPSKRGTLISKNQFKQLLNKVYELIDELGEVSDEQRAILKSKIAQLNQKVLAHKIDALFDHYVISRRDFEGNVVKNLISLRNNIVHKGTVRNSEDIWPQIILVRELLTRILLKEIGFVGRYCCYVGGLHDRDFP